MLKIVFAALIGAIPAIALAQTTAPSPAPVVTAVPSPNPSVLPTTSPSPTPIPASSPAALPTPLVLPPAAPPQIIAVSVNEHVFHSGDTISATVITSTNVPAVELRVMGKAIRFTRTDFGIFQLSYKLPHIPRRFLKDYPAQIVAMNTVNAFVSRDITISLR